MTLHLDAFDDKSKKKSKTKYRAALGVGSAVSLFGIGSTLAANITLSGDNNVEFGQGVVTTAACDEDGFTITPVTYFDNDDSIFKVDYVEVSGVNLTPEGAGYAAGGYSTQSDAKAARPGKYYDAATSTWKNTCDGVVLDFKAYTDDANYASYRNDAYDISSPIGWSQSFFTGGSLSNAQNPGFAVVIDSNDAGSNYDYNFATNGVDKSDVNGSPNATTLRIAFENTWTTSNAKFRFINGNDPNAASISKITVQSMKEFSDSYYAITEYDDNWDNWVNTSLGNPSTGWGP
jgi:hypothetical protein